MGVPDRLHGQLLSSRLHTFRMNNLSKYPVLSIPVVGARFPEAIAQIETWALAGDRAYGISFADAHQIARARQEKDFGDCLRKLDAVMPDGRPVLWWVNRHLPASMKFNERLSGPDMFRRFQEHSASYPQLRHFYFGGSQTLLDRVLKIVAERAPGMTIAGSYSPPFGNWPPDEFHRVKQMLIESRANVIWVGLGCPKQERWVADHLAELPPGVYLAVGAAFAFYADQVKRAPLWMRKMGIEWLHRLISEPRRLWKRYFVYNCLFIGYTLQDLFDRRAER